MSLEVFFGILIWTAPLVILTFISSRIKSIKILILLRCIYMPYLFLMAFAFLWFWGGDGGINLWLVPLVFFVLVFLFFKNLIPKLSKSARIIDLAWFSITLSAFLTIWIVVLIYRIIGKQLLIV